MLFLNVPTALGSYHSFYQTPDTISLGNRIRWVMGGQDIDSGFVGDELEPDSASPDYANYVARRVRSSLEVALPSRPQGQVHISFDEDGYAEEVTKQTWSSNRKPFSRPPKPEPTWHKRVYRDLDLQNQDEDDDLIRLLELEQGTSGPIITHLKVAKLKEIKNGYDALSYTWGKPEPKGFISINGITADIYPNLLDALSSLRLADKNRILWVDAICINQQNPAEKSWQLPKMGTVYQMASRVRIFLGQDSTAASIPTLFDFLNRPHPTRFLGIPTKMERAAEFKKAGVNEFEACRGFVDLTRLGWWTRVWVLQEFYLAKREPCWHWGNRITSNSCLKRDLEMLSRSVFDLARQHSSMRDVANQSLPPREFPLSLRLPFKTEKARIESLISRRLETHSFDNPKRRYRELFAGCQVEHDLIYGLVALFEPAFGEIFVDDYQMAPELLWASLLVVLVRFYDWGDIFWWYPHRMLHKDKLASWLLDFRRRAVPME